MAYSLAVACNISYIILVAATKKSK